MLLTERNEARNTSFFFFFFKQQLEKQSKENFFQPREWHRAENKDYMTESLQNIL